MSANRLRFDGLDELRQALRSLPEELTADASTIVQDEADGAAAEIEAAYPERTGELRKGVVVTRESNGRFGVGLVVKNKSKLGYIFENGTQARHTALGANRGSMPPGHTFIPRVIRRRRAMYERLKALLASKGLLVSGDA